MQGFEFVPAAQVDAIVSRVAAPLLASAGFVAVSRRRWVRSYPPVRHIFEIVALKGTTSVPRWGISLDFVPHTRGQKLAWHRTEKSALPDLVYDPIDFHRDWADRWSFRASHGPDQTQREVERVLPVAIRSACEWLDGVLKPSDALERAEWLRTAPRPSLRFGFDNFVQQRLALAFLLAHAGRRGEAEQELERWITLHGEEQLRDKLLALLR